MLRLIEKKATRALTRLSHFMFRKRISMKSNWLWSREFHSNYCIRLLYYQKRASYTSLDLSSLEQNEFSNLRRDLRALCIYFTHLTFLAAVTAVPYHNTINYGLCCFFLLILLWSSFWCFTDNSWENGSDSSSLLTRRVFAALRHYKLAWRETKRTNERTRVCWNNTATFSYQTCFNDLPTVMSHEDMNERT